MDAHAQQGLIGPRTARIKRRTATMPLTLLLGTAAGVLALATSAAASDRNLSISADFPGGNIVVEQIAGNTVRLHQDLRDTPRFWFHWAFEVRDAHGRTVDFVFTQGNVFGSRGPAVSTDGGRTWDWLGTQEPEGDRFRYAFGPNDRRVRFAFAIPYTAANLQDFLQRHASSPALRRAELTRTPNGRSVELLKAGRLDGMARHRVLLTARHHACESTANFVLEGILEAALDDAPTGRWLRDRVEILAVPFLDKDGVEAGDQGKLRAPHDHWLDYEGTSRYAETGALRRLFDQENSPAPVDIALDLHCPYIRDRKIYFALGSNPDIAESTARFCRTFEQTQQGPLVYRSRDDSAFGTGWNVAATYEGRRSFWQWAESLPQVRVVATLEVPYASVGEVAVTPDAARQVGRDLAAAISRFLDPSSR